MSRKLILTIGLTVALLGVATIAQANSPGLAGQMSGQTDMGTMMDDGGMGDMGTSHDGSEMMEMMGAESMAHMVEMMGPEATSQMMSMMMSGEGMSMTGDGGMGDFADHDSMMTDHHGG